MTKYKINEKISMEKIIVGDDIGNDYISSRLSRKIISAKGNITKKEEYFELIDLSDLKYYIGMLDLRPADITKITKLYIKWKCE